LKRHFLSWTASSRRGTQALRGAAVATALFGAFNPAASHDVSLLARRKNSDVRHEHDDGRSFRYLSPTVSPLFPFGSASATQRFRGIATGGPAAGASPGLPRDQRGGRRW
jgi:hypothetical protein